MRIRTATLPAAAVLALALGACATTTFQSSWKAPDAAPLNMQKGDKVIALVIAKNDALRRAGEAHLASELDLRGYTGVPAYTIMSDADVQDEGKAQRVITTSGAKAIVVLRPQGTTQEVSSTPGYYGSPYYNGMWGGGYWGYGWGGAYIPGDIRTDTYVHIETLIYDLEQNKLVWAGQSKTMNPANVEKGVHELATAVSKELQKSGLVAAAK
jgi:hypothetical protein